MRVVVAVPYRAHPDLARLWGTLSGWWAHHHPNWPVVVADSTGDWSRAEAANTALAGKWDVAVIADVCVWQHPDAIRRSVAAVTERPGMIVPYEVCVRLTRQGTAEFVAHRGEGLFIGWKSERVADVRQPHGGITVIDRATWETVGGMDERFRMWGGEDDALMLSAQTLGLLRRTDGVLWQLHHPPMPRDPQRRPQALAVRYRQAAKAGPDAIRALIVEREAQ